MVRAALLVAGMVMATPNASALEAADLAGSWETQWSNSAHEPLSGGGPLLIRPDSSPGGLDGVIAAPGFDGLANGEVFAAADGTLVWSGAWVSVWPEGVTRGAFRFVFSDENSFSGTWSSDDGEVENARWVGRRSAE